MREPSAIPLGVSTREVYWSDFDRGLRIWLVTLLEKLVLINLEILHEDNHLLVINKPCGLVTQGAESGLPSVYDAAIEYLRVKYNKPGNVFVGIVSRLDALASGVLVLARTSKAASRLSEQIRQQSTSKRYLALVEGHVETSVRAVQLTHHLLKHDEKHRIEVVDAKRSGAQLAELRYHTVLNVGRQSIVEVELVTGRKHQIRVQLSAIGHPIVGDHKYGSETEWPDSIGLHCYRNEIEHPTLRERVSFQSLPRHWQSKIGTRAVETLSQMMESSFNLDEADEKG